jgi:hypothetical protein
MQLGREGMTDAEIFCRVRRSLPYAGKMKLSTMSLITCACLSFSFSRLRVNSASILTLSRSFRSIVRNCNQPMQCLVELTFSFTAFSSSLWSFEVDEAVHGYQSAAAQSEQDPTYLKMQPLQQRCSPPSLPLQTPITTKSLYKWLFLPHRYFRHVFKQTIDDYARYDWWTRSIGFSMCSSCLCGDCCFTCSRMPTGLFIEFGSIFEL